MAPDGFVNLIKPPGMTSHDVVAFMRRQTGASRVGHLGTLDPAAAGVLPICLGRATRLFHFAQGTKVYRAEVCFGLTTSTLDAEGEVTSLADASAVTAAAVSAALQDMRGEQEQKPPAFSAARVAGKRLHARARQGEVVSAPARTVQFHALDLLDFRPGPRARALVKVECSAGAYVRVLAEDLGRALGCGASLAFLLRTRAGRFPLSDALTLEEVSACPQEALLPVDWPLAHLPRASLCGRSAVAFLSGTAVLAEGPPAWPVRVYDGHDLFLGLGELAASGQLRPRLILATREEVRP